MITQNINEHRKFWSTVAQKYDLAVELQIGVDTRAMVRERLAREGSLGKVAEFGCGTGFFTAVLAEHAESVLATDLAPGMLAVARQRVRAANVSFQEQDCQQTSLPDSSFDTIFLSLVIHFTHAAKTLSEARRILKPGGTLIIANGDPAALNRANRLRWLVRVIYYGITLQRTKPPSGMTKNLISRSDLCTLLNQRGFEIQCTEAFRNEARPSNMPIDYIKAVKA